MTDTTSTDVITFQTPMTLQADAEVRLACDGEIQVRSRRYSTLVSAQTPITLSVSTKSDVTPFDNLNEDLARGWRKLPDELKIEILSYKLVAANVISSNKSNDCDSNFTLGRELRHHLALGLDFALLAGQIFYKKNVMNVSATSPHDLWPPNNRLTERSKTQHRV